MKTMSYSGAMAKVPSPIALKVPSLADAKNEDTKTDGKYSPDYDAFVSWIHAAPDIEPGTSARFTITITDHATGKETDMEAVWLNEMFIRESHGAELKKATGWHLPGEGSLVFVPVLLGPEEMIHTCKEITA